MEGRNETETKSFRIEHLLHRSTDPETTSIELSTSLRQSPKLSSKNKSVDKESPSLNRYQWSKKSVSSSCRSRTPLSSSSTSPEAQINTNINPIGSNYIQPSMHIHNPPTFSIHGHYQPFHAHYSRMFPAPIAIPHPLDSKASNASLHSHPQFMRPAVASQDMASLLLHHQTNNPTHSDNHHRTPHLPYSLEFPLWHGQNISVPHGSLLSPYSDPRYYEYKYPASTLFSSLACGTDGYLNGRGLHPLLHGESKRKGGQIRFSNSQTALLEKAFVEHKYQNAHDRRKLAHSLGLTDRQVKTWFQNRRAKWRKVGLKDDDSDKKARHNNGFNETSHLSVDAVRGDRKSLARFE